MQSFLGNGAIPAGARADVGAGWSSVAPGLRRPFTRGDSHPHAAPWNPTGGSPGVEQRSWGWTGVAGGSPGVENAPERGQGERRGSRMEQHGGAGSRVNPSCVLRAASWGLGCGSFTPFQAPPSQVPLLLPAPGPLPARSEGGVGTFSPSQRWRRGRGRITPSPPAPQHRTPVNPRLRGETLVCDGVEQGRASRGHPRPHIPACWGLACPHPDAPNTPPSFHTHPAHVSLPLPSP